MDYQTLIVIAAVSGAFIYFGYKVYKMVVSKGDESGCSCSSTSGCSTCYMYEGNKKDK